VKAAAPPPTVRIKRWNAGQPVLLTMTLIGINLALYVVSVVVNKGGISAFSDNGPFQWRFALVGDSVQIFRGGTIYRGVADGAWWRMITSGFTHYGVLHVGLNCWILYQLGHMLEPALGRVRFGLLYFAALLGGSAGAMLLSPHDLTAGASGAVFGLLGAAAIGLRQRGINVWQTGIGVTILINLALTFGIGGISIGGHVGGLITGAIAGAALLAPRRGKPPAWVYAVPVGVMIASAFIVEVAARR
jgi:membrane associated rhomboid family serine protease